MRIPLTLKQHRDQKPPHILLVDDDEEDQILLKTAFEFLDSNYTLDFVSNGKETFKYLRQMSGQELPDLIVLDYHLPQHNGGHLLKQLNDNECYRDIKKVILSTSTYSDLSRFPDSSDVEHFCKPDSLSGLIQLATELLQLCTPESTESMPVPI